MAMMLWLPTDMVVLTPLVATPLVKVTDEPKLEPSILNWTVPVGVPPPGAIGVTVAVNETGWPKQLGLTEAVTTVAVSALSTICVRLGEVLVLKLASPL